MQEETLDLTPLQKIIDQYKTQPGAVVPVLQKAQGIYGWLPREVMEAEPRMRIFSSASSAEATMVAILEDPASIPAITFGLAMNYRLFSWGSSSVAEEVASGLRMIGFSNLRSIT